MLSSKVSDPIIFGHAVRAFFKAVIEKHSEVFEKCGVNFNNGIGGVEAKIAGEAKKDEIMADIKALTLTLTLLTLTLPLTIGRESSGLRWHREYVLWSLWVGAHQGVADT